MHQYFGELATLNRTAHSASVVSVSSVEVLVMSKYDFHHYVDLKTQEAMASYAASFYFDEASIARSIAKQHKWESYKRSLLRDVLGRR